MKPHACTGCGAKFSQGYIFDNPEIRICGECRHVWLTWLRVNGFAMSSDNFIIRELCEDSHIVPDDHWTYYDVVSQDKGIILRLEK